MSCETFKIDIESRDKRIASLEAQLQDFGAAIRLLGSKARTKPLTSPQAKEAHEQQIVRSALLVLEHRRTGKFENVGDIAAHILENGHMHSDYDGPQQSIPEALSVLAHGMTGEFQGAQKLAQRIIERGDWDLNMLSTDDSGYGTRHLQLECANCHTRVTPEWRRGPSGQLDLCNSCGLRWAKQMSRSTSETNANSVSRSSHTVASTTTNIETQDSWLRDNNLAMNATPGDQQVSDTLRASPETPDPNNAFSSEIPTEISQDPLYKWYESADGPWIPEIQSEHSPSNLVCPTCNKTVKTSSELKYRSLERIFIRS